MKKAFLLTITFLFCCLCVSDLGLARLGHVYQQHLPKYNMLLNPGGEHGKQFWSVTGSGTLTVDKTTPMAGQASLQWDASATGEYLTSSSTGATIPIVLRGQDCEIRMKYLYSGTAGDYQLYAYDGTGNVHEKLDIPLSPSASVPSVARAAFACPESGTLQFRMESTANGGVIEIEEMWVGSNVQNFDYSTAEEYGYAKHDEGDTGCLWNGGSSSWDDYPADGDCDGVFETVRGKIEHPSTLIPGITVPSLEAGNYQIFMYAKFQTDGSHDCAWRWSDGTDYSGLIKSDVNTDHNQNLIGTFSYDTAQTDVTFRVQRKRNSGGSNCYLNNDGTDEWIEISLYRFPLESQKAVSIDTTPFEVRGNIGGANISLSTSDVATYTHIEDSGLDMTLQTGSRPAEIPCTIGESTGLTCSSGNEVLGVSWFPDRAGTYRICFAFGFRVLLGTSQNWDGTFQIIETDNDDETSTVYETKAYAYGYVGASSVSGVDVGQSPSWCADVPISTVGKKTHLIKYEQNVTGSFTKQLRLDRGASVGNPELSFSIIRVSDQLPQAYLLPIDYQELDISSSGDFSAGQPLLRIAKNEQIVTLTWTALNHPSDNEVFSAVGFIPEKYRPAHLVRNTFANSTTALYRVEIHDDGKFGVDYKNYSGSATNKTQALGGSVSWVIDD